jgi:thioredoxin 1
MFAPVFEDAATQHPDIVFGKVDTEANQQLAGAAGIMSIPTLMAFRENVLVYSQPGALPAAALEDLIGKVRDLDMAEVHAAIAAREAAPDDA